LSDLRKFLGNEYFSEINLGPPCDGFDAQSRLKLSLGHCDPESVQMTPVDQLPPSEIKISWAQFEAALASCRGVSPADQRRLCDHARKRIGVAANGAAFALKRAEIAIVVCHDLSPEARACTLLHVWQVLGREPRAA
jgi:hypothetical protein